MLKEKKKRDEKKKKLEKSKRDKNQQKSEEFAATIKIRDKKKAQKESEAKIVWGRVRVRKITYLHDAQLKPGKLLHETKILRKY